MPLDIRARQEKDINNGPRALWQRAPATSVRCIDNSKTICFPSADMATAVAIAFLCLSHIGAFAFPAPQTDSPTGSSSKFQWQIYKSCDDGNRSAITNAWRDSVKFADALNSWKPKERYQPAMEMYMGDRCTFDEGEYNFTRQIQGESSGCPVKDGAAVLTSEHRHGETDPRTLRRGVGVRHREPLGLLQRR